MTNSAGAVIQTYDYDAFGNITAQTGALTAKYAYKTKEYSPETGLVFFGRRYYNPLIGRFITKDPLGQIDGPNVYLYLNNDPINKYDPWGLEACNQQEETPVIKPSIDWDKKIAEEIERLRNEQQKATQGKSTYWGRYAQHLNKYLINPGPYAAALAGGLWPKSLAPATEGRPPLLGSSNPLTSVPRAFGIPFAGSAIIRSGATGIGIATVAAGGYNIGVFIGGLVYSAFPGSNGIH